MTLDLSAVQAKYGAEGREFIVQLNSVFQTHDLSLIFVPVLKDFMIRGTFDEERLRQVSYHFNSSYRTRGWCLQIDGETAPSASAMEQKEGLLARLSNLFERLHLFLFTYQHYDNSRMAYLCAPSPSESRSSPLELLRIPEKKLSPNDLRAVKKTHGEAGYQFIILINAVLQEYHLSIGQQHATYPELFVIQGAADRTYLEQAMSTFKHTELTSGWSLRVYAQQANGSRAARLCSPIPYSNDPPIQFILKSD